MKVLYYHIYKDGKSSEAVFTHDTQEYGDLNRALVLVEAIEDLKSGLVNLESLNKGGKVSFDAQDKERDTIQGLHFTIDAIESLQESLLEDGDITLASTLLFSASDDNQISRLLKAHAVSVMDHDFKVEFKKFPADGDPYLSVITVLLSMYASANKGSFEDEIRSDKEISEGLTTLIYKNELTIEGIFESFLSSELLTSVLNSLESGLGDDLKSEVSQAFREDPKALIWSSDKYEHPELKRSR